VTRRHSDWHKLVPAALTEKPPVWRGPPPQGKDARWPTFKRQRNVFRQEGLEALRQHFRITPDANSDDFLRDLAVHLLSLFPRFQTAAESRGRKRQKVLEPESVQRRIKRDRKITKRK
jgi:hypothetical protein